MAARIIRQRNGQPLGGRVTHEMAACRLVYGSAKPPLCVSAHVAPRRRPNGSWGWGAGTWPARQKSHFSAAKTVAVTRWLTAARILTTPTYGRDLFISESPQTLRFDWMAKTEGSCGA